MTSLFLNDPYFKHVFRPLLTIALLLVCIAPVGAQAPGSSSPAQTATQSASPTIAGNTNGSTGSGLTTDAGQRTTETPAANANHAAGTRIKLGDNEAEGPAWFVLVIGVAFFILAIMALRTIPRVGEALGKKTLSVTAILVLLVICALGVYFVGRTFGGNEETTVFMPQALPVAEAEATAQPQPSPKQKVAPKTEVVGANAAAAVEETPKPTPLPTPFHLTVAEVTVPDGGDAKVAGLGDVVIVRVKNLKEELNRQQNLPRESTEERIEPRKLVLYLEKIEMKKLYPFAVDPDRGELQFRLNRTPDSRDAWLNFLAQPKHWVVPVEASVGPEGEAPLSGGQAFALRLYYPRLLKIAVILFVVFLVSFFIAAKRTTIIRDSGPMAPVGGPLFRPYSLARAQVAWWFFIILGSFLFIALVTWDFDTLTTSALVLLGIGTGTALGSAMVDSNKRESTNGDLRTLKPQEAKLAAAVEELKAKKKDAEAKLAGGGAVDQTSLAAWNTELAAKEAELEQVKIQVSEAASGLEKPVTDGFVSDVLSDVNGITFHRFQIVVWTIVLGLIFIWSVWRKLTMPEFSDTLLALMGISAGTYLGFKIPERQTKAEDTQSAGEGNGAADGVGAADGGAAAGGADAADGGAANGGAGEGEENGA